jgi:hypothetical protein
MIAENLYWWRQTRAGGWRITADRLLELAARPTAFEDSAGG